MELTILLPCLNEEKTVAACVHQAAAFFVQNQLEGEVLVVDNGSTDRSEPLARKAGARVVSCPKQGYGNALRYGIEKASGRYVIMADCDCSYPLEELMPFVNALRAGASMVIGDRFVLPMEEGAMSISHRYFGVPFLSFLGRLRYQTMVRDFHCGLRAVNRKDFLKLGCRCEGMEFATEMIARASLAGLEIVQLPVNFRKDQRGHKSHLRTLRDGFRHLKILIKLPK